MNLNYAGDCTGSVGRLMGPDMHGAFYEVKGCTYNATEDRSVLTLSPVLRNDPRSMIRDGFGQPYIVS